MASMYCHGCLTSHQLLLQLNPHLDPTRCELVTSDRSGTPPLTRKLIYYVGDRRKTGRVLARGHLQPSILQIYDFPLI